VTSRLPRSISSQPRLKFPKGTGKLPAANTNCRRFTQFRSLAANSGLVSLGPSFIESYRNAATHVSRTLRGEKPGDLPVQAQAHLNKVARQLNERPRETLQFETPAERLNACVASTG
jgi:hypothetical protein